MNKKWNYLLGFLALITVAVWTQASSAPDENLHIIACDVGQGDATLIVYGEIQILVDGGPNDSVMSCLSKYVPVTDREIELVILTHPDVDHFRGLPAVFKSYAVETLLVSGLDSSSQSYQALKNAVGGSAIDTKIASAGMVIRLGKLQLDILHPSKEFLSENAVPDPEANVLGVHTTSKNKNDFSIVVKLSLGEFDALLTGDIGIKPLENILAGGSVGAVEYLKVPHHGSKNNLSGTILQMTNPEVAVISVGEKNRYEHPHKDVIKLLNDYGIETLRSDEVGDIEVVTDGKSYWINN